MQISSPALTIARWCRRNRHHTSFQLDATAIRSSATAPMVCTSDTATALPLPLREGVGGRGRGHVRTPPPPNPLPQGEGEDVFCIFSAFFAAFFAASPIRYVSIRMRGSIIASAMSDSSVPTMVRNE